MPFVKRDTLSTLHDKNRALTETVQNFQEMGVHIALAGELRDEIIRIMHEYPDIPGSEVGELAYRLVLDRETENARAEIVTKYEQTHRRVLYEQVVADIETAEGQEISEAVRLKVETDPDLAQELRDSARRELAARAMGVVRQAITGEQEQVIASETERQIQLDRFDVRFALDGRLDLTRGDLLRVLQPEDKLKMYFKVPNRNEPGCLTLQWRQDAHNNKGWVYEDASTQIRTTHGQIYTPNKDRFINLVTLNKDLKRGISVEEADIITSSFPLALGSYTAKGKLQSNPLFTDYQQQHPVVITGIDLQTRDLYFYHEAIDAKS